MRYRPQSSHALTRLSSASSYRPYQADLHEKIVAIDRTGLLSCLLDGDGPVTAASLRASV